MSESLLNTIEISILGAVLSFLAAWFWFSRNLAVEKAKTLAIEHDKTLVRVSDLEAKLAVVNLSVVPLNLAMQAMLIKELTHYHTPEMDALMVKLGPPITLTTAEEVRLGVMLDERTKDMAPEIPEEERDAAHILPVIIKRAKVESKALTPFSEMKPTLVTVAAVVEFPLKPLSVQEIGPTLKPSEK